MKTQQPIELHLGEILFLRYSSLAWKKLLDLIYGPTKTNLCIISLYFWLPSIEMV